MQRETMPPTVCCAKTVCWYCYRIKDSVPVVAGVPAVTGILTVDVVLAGSGIPVRRLVPDYAGAPTIVGAPAVVAVFTVAGVSADAGVLAVVGVPAVAGIPAVGNVHAAFMQLFLSAWTYALIHFDLSDHYYQKDIFSAIGLHMGKSNVRPDYRLLI